MCNIMCNSEHVGLYSDWLLKRCHRAYKNYDGRVNYDDCNIKVYDRCYIFYRLSQNQHGSIETEVTGLLKRL